MSVSFLGNQKLETNCQLNGISGNDLTALSEVAGENSDRAGNLYRPGEKLISRLGL